MRATRYRKRCTARADGSYRIRAAMHGPAPEGAADGLSKSAFQTLRAAFAAARQVVPAPPLTSKAGPDFVSDTSQEAASAIGQGATGPEGSTPGSSASASVLS